MQHKTTAKIGVILDIDIANEKKNRETFTKTLGAKKKALEICKGLRYGKLF